MNNFIKDLPIYLNGFAVGSLFFVEIENTTYRIFMYVLAMTSFL